MTKFDKFIDAKNVEIGILNRKMEEIRASVQNIVSLYNSAIAELKETQKDETKDAKFKKPKKSKLNKE